jgi:hypothetical protein
MRIGFPSEDAALDAANRVRRSLRGVSVMGWVAEQAPGGGYFARIGIERQASVEVWPMDPRTSDMADLVAAEWASNR